MDGDLNAPMSGQGAGMPPAGQPMGSSGITPNQTPDQMPEAQKKSSGLIIGIIIIIILILIGAAAYYYYTKYMNKATTPTITPVTAVYTPVSSQESIASDYTNTTAITPTTAKSQAVDKIFQPILKNVFTNNVKLKTELGPMMTYVVNRQITAADVSAVQTGVNNAGYRTIDSSASQLTVSTGPYTWVITFSLNNSSKATIDISF
jgi:flagellar basal body-associated protein FliL